MRHLGSSRRAKFFVALGILAISTVPGWGMAHPTPAAIAKFNSYISTVEARLNQQHRSPGLFLAPTDTSSLSKGKIVVEQITPPAGNALPGAMLHDWRGSAFVPGAKVVDFERVLKDFQDYPREFSPEVLQTKVLAQDGGHYEVKMRVRQRDAITVLMDTTYDIAFGQLDARHGYSISRSTEISELNSGGNPLSPAEDHGFLWRMNTYWSYAQRDGGLYIQVESISLTRSIPTGLGWLVGPFVQSIPRKSMKFTLRSARNALRDLETSG